MDSEEWRKGERGRGQGKTGDRETGRRNGETEKEKDEGREGRWTPHFLRYGCASDYSGNRESDKAAHKVG